jgi:hypothetical protein
MMTALDVIASMNEARVRSRLAKFDGAPMQHRFR